MGIPRPFLLFFFLTGENIMCRMWKKGIEKMMKTVGEFRGEKVEKTLIFYTHTHTHTHTHTCNHWKAKKIADGDFSRIVRTDDSEDLFYTSFGFKSRSVREGYLNNAHIFFTLSFLHGLALKPNGIF